MRVLRPVVCSQAPIVLSLEPDRAERCRIGSQPVGHNPARRKTVLLKQFHHEFLCGLCIPSALDEEIQHLTLVVDRPRASIYRRGSKSPFHRGANDRSVPRGKSPSRQFLPQEFADQHEDVLVECAVFCRGKLATLTLRVMSEAEAKKQSLRLDVVSGPSPRGQPT
jgi:hypothetical protein